MVKALIIETKIGKKATKIDLGEGKPAKNRMKRME